MSSSTFSKIVVAIKDRASEPSTYAGVSLLALLAAQALGHDTDGEIATAASIVAAVTAVIAKEGSPWLKKAVANAGKVLQGSEEALPALTALRNALADQKGAPKALILALDDATSALKNVEAVQEKMSENEAKQ